MVICPKDAKKADETMTKIHSQSITTDHFCSKLQKGGWALSLPAQLKQLR